MHKEGFVVSVIDSNGDILREEGKEVYLPFESEYQLVLKNKSGTDAVADVQIDGTKATGQHRIIINNNGRVNLERFILNGNLSRGKRFKFVTADGNAQDPYNTDNGWIEVKFYKKKEQAIAVSDESDYTPWKPWPIPNMPRQRRLGPSYSGACYSSCDVGYTSCNNSTMPDSGVTIGGRNSTQKFREEYFGDIGETPITIRLKIVSTDKAHVVSSTRKLRCRCCNFSNARCNKYCGGCGNKLRR